MDKMFSLGAKWRWRGSCNFDYEIVEIMHKPLIEFPIFTLAFIDGSLAFIYGPVTYESAQTLLKEFTYLG